MADDASPAATTPPDGAAGGPSARAPLGAPFAFASFPLCFVMSSAGGGTRGARGRITARGAVAGNRCSDAAPSAQARRIAPLQRSIL